MPRFEPFPGVRYDPHRVDLDDVTAPPYDVISAEEQALLEVRSPYNVVHVDLARDEHHEGDRYTVASRRFDEWLAGGILVPDDEPAFYVYRMGYHDQDGRPRQTSGVIGALELGVPGEGDVLPHEHTMAKPRDDRLNLLRACRTNLSPIWGLSLAEGLSQLTEMTGPPVARCTDEQGVHHRVWRVTQPGVVATIREAVGAAPVVIADGHHRYETALHYRAERAAERGGGPGPEDLLMAYVVELTEAQLTVRPIHRLISGLPEGFDLLSALSTFFEPLEAGAPCEDLAARMDEAGALALATEGRAWLLRPRPGTPVDLDADGDADRLDMALAGLPAHAVAYQHGIEAALGLVEKGEAQAAVLLRPATVAEIAAAAAARRRMPTKSTFFHPKPRTGLVFRRLDG